MNLILVLVSPEILFSRVLRGMKDVPGDHNDKKSYSAKPEGLGDNPRVMLARLIRGILKLKDTCQ